MDPVLEREQAPVQSEMSEEEREHRRHMSERMQALLSGSDELLSEFGARAYRPSVYSDLVGERHEAVVPTSPDAPSASRRMDDYMVIKRGQPMQRFGDMPVSGVRDYPAPVSEAVQERTEAPAAPAQKKRGLFEDLLYRDGELISTAPAAGDVEASVYTPAAPAPQTETSFETYEAPAAVPSSSDEDDDAKPTRRTMLHQNVAEERNTGLLSALSFKTKVVLASIAAVIVLLLAVVCINTAVINSLDESIAAREQEIAELTDSLDGLNGEIGRVTASDYVEAWASERGMIK